MKFIIAKLGLRRIIGIAAALAVIVAVIALFPTPQRVRNQAWEDEVNTLRQAIFDLHPLVNGKTNSQAGLPQEILATSEEVAARIHAEADALIAQIPRLSDEEIKLNLSRIVAPLGDGHSGFGEDFWVQTATPFFFKYLTDGYYFYAYYDDNYPNREQEIALLGSKLIAVNGHDPQEVELAFPQLQGCENIYYIRCIGMYVFQSPAMLYAMGLHDELANPPEYTLETHDGQLVNITPSGMGSSHIPGKAFYSLPGAEEKVILAKNDRESSPDFYGWHVDGHELFLLKDNTVLHIRCYNFSGRKLKSLESDVKTALTDNPQIERIIVDMRGNQGGYDYYVVPMIKAIHSVRWDLCQNGDVYAVTDGESYSASLWTTVRLKEYCNAAHVGAPTGQPPVFFYGGLKNVALPKSGLTANISEYHTEQRGYNMLVVDYTPYIGLDALYPDVHIERSIEQYMADIDPVLEWILAQ